METARQERPLPSVIDAIGRTPLVELSRLGKALGDAITFDCSTPHRLTNAGSGVLEAIFVVSPPAF